MASSLGPNSISIQLWKLKSSDLRSPFLLAFRAFELQPEWPIDLCLQQGTQWLTTSNASKNRFRRPKNHMVNFLTTTLLLRMKFLSFFFIAVTKYLTKGKSKGAYVASQFKGMWSITANMAAGGALCSMELTREQQNKKVRAQLVFSFLLFFLFSPGFQPREFRVSFPSSFMSLSKRSNMYL